LSDFSAIIEAARANMIARHAKILDVELDIIEPHKPPFVYYDDYLASSYWQETRKRKLELTGFVCQECGKTDTVLHVHHLTYERLGYELDTDLIVLCESCHRRKHGIKTTD